MGIIVQRPVLLAPFVGAILAFVINGEKLTAMFFAGAAFMLAGTVFVAYDTMVKHHRHCHTHTIVHTHNGVTHTFFPPALYPHFLFIHE